MFILYHYLGEYKGRSVNLGVAPARSIRPIPSLSFLLLFQQKGRNFMAILFSAKPSSISPLCHSMRCCGGPALIVQNKRCEFAGKFRPLLANPHHRHHDTLRCKLARVSGFQPFFITFFYAFL